MYTGEQILKQLDKLEVKKGRPVLMHTSLRSIGKVEGGAEALLDILVEYFTKDGGLFCVPTHTWDNLGKNVITLDVLNSESNIGTFSNIALADKRGVRSLNPSHSMVVFGDRDKALEFIKDDEFVKTPTAPESAYGKLFDMDGYILLVGVAQDKNTYLHTVAEILSLDNRMGDKPMKVTVKDANGKITEKDFTLFDCSFTDDISLLFPKYETAFRYHKCITDGYIGNAPTQLCSARGLKNTVELIFKNSRGVDPLSLENPIPAKWYCK